MANLAGVVQQLRKERDQAAKILESLNAALAGLHVISGRRVGDHRLSRQQGRESPLPSVHDGLGSRLTEHLV